MLKLKETKGFTIVTGVHPGYFHNNSASKNERKDELENICELWKEIAFQIQEKTGLYISAVIQPSKTVYNEDWGCPIGGEDTYTITGVANPEFIPDIEKWIEAVGLCADMLKVALTQSTLTIQIYPQQIAYLKEE